MNPFDGLNVHHGWTLKEKKALYDAVETHGDENLDALHEAVPTKTKHEISKYLLYFKSAALKSLESDDDCLLLMTSSSKVVKVNEMQLRRETPLRQWLEVLTEQNINSIPTISRAFELIAHLENLPKPEEMRGVDLKKLYLYISKALAGETPEPLDSPCMQFLTHSLIYLAGKVKRTRSPEDIDLINSISRVYHDALPTDLNRFSSDVPLPVRELLVSHVYNPLGLAVDSLLLK